MDTSSGWKFQPSLEGQRGSREDRSKFIEVDSHTLVTISL